MVNPGNRIPLFRNKPLNHNDMRSRKIMCVLLAAVSLAGCSKYRDYSEVPYEEPNGKAWEDPLVSQINRKNPVPILSPSPR